MLLRDIGIELLGLVTIDAGDVGRGMATGRPVGEKPRGFDLVAFDAGLPLLAHAPFDAELLDLGEIRLEIGRAHV